MQTPSVSSSLELSITRQDVIKNPEKMGIWVNQNLKKQHLAKFEGCALAVKEFGNNNPFSDSKIHRLECMQEFKDTRKQPGAKKAAQMHWNQPTKKSYLKKLAKLSKSKLKILVDESEGSSQILSETLGSLSKEY